MTRGLKETMVHSLVTQQVDLLSGKTQFNPLMPSMFAGITAIFVAVVVIGKCSGRADAVNQARHVFAQYVVVFDLPLYFCC